MGGNLYTMRRYQADEYRELESEVVETIEYTLNTNVKGLLYYRNKESFGDMDILVEADFLPQNYMELIISAFNLNSISQSETIKPSNWTKNGNVISFQYKKFQIDLILMSSQYFESAYYYYAYNDLGNLLGRLTHKMGFKFGHKGLSLIIRPTDGDDHVIGEVTVTQEIEEILDIVGLDPYVYHKGFDDVEDIFKYVASSKYFNPEIYLLDNRNATSRIRDKKRKTYTEFLNWCEARKDELPKFDFGSVVEKGGYSIREPWYTDKILSRYPEVEDIVDGLIYEYEQNKKLKEKLSGGVVMKVTGIEGKELGILYRQIKETLLDRYSREQLIDMNAHTIECMIRSVKLCLDNGFKYPYIPVEFAENLIRNEGK